MATDKKYKSAQQVGAMFTSELKYLYSWSIFRFYEAPIDGYYVVKYHPDGNIYYYKIPVDSMYDLMSTFYHSDKNFMAGYMSDILESMNITLS
jgi:hypothetical protein